jgi:hypothetical protein
MNITRVKKRERSDVKEITIKRRSLRSLGFHSERAERA